MNYEKDITIDESSLDIEWLEQPQLMIRYATKAAESRLERDLAKERLDVLKAELDKEIRTDPEKFEIAKVTETAIQAAVLTHPKYKEASEQFIQLRYEAEVLQAAVNAIEHRKSALENLVKLFGQQYFAGPKMPRNITEEREMKQQRVDARIAKKLIRRNRNDSNQ